MAPLIGYLKGNRGETHRLGQDIITSKLATWEGNIETNLLKDGSASVAVDGVEVWKGFVGKKKMVVR